MRNTHFRIKESTAIAVSAIGSRPGDPTADIVFNCAFNPALGKIRRRFIAAQLFEIQSYDGSTLPRSDANSEQQQIALHTDVTFFDDTRNMLIDADAARLVNRLKAAAAIVDDCCIESGLLPKYSPQKTDVLARFAGKNAQKIRTHVFNHFNCNLPFTAKHRGELRLDFVQSYLDLGVCASSCGTKKRESSPGGGHSPSLR